MCSGVLCKALSFRYVLHKFSQVLFSKAYSPCVMIPCVMVRVSMINHTIAYYKSYGSTLFKAAVCVNGLKNRHRLITTNGLASLVVCFFNTIGGKRKHVGDTNTL